MCVFRSFIIIAYCFDSDDFDHPAGPVLSVMRPTNDGNHADILEVVVQVYDRSSTKIRHASYHRGAANWLNVLRVTEADNLPAVEYHSIVVAVAALRMAIAS